jgi:hypothetical protein
MSEEFLATDQYGIIFRKFQLFYKDFCKKEKIQLIIYL